MSNLVDVHVANVVKKLGKDFITTRRGEGYQIQCLEIDPVFAPALVRGVAGRGAGGVV